MKSDHILFIEEPELSLKEFSESLIKAFWNVLDESIRTEHDMVFSVDGKIYVVEYKRLDNMKTYLDQHKQEDGLPKLIREYARSHELEHQ